MEQGTKAITPNPFWRIGKKSMRSSRSIVNEICDTAPLSFSIAAPSKFTMPLTTADGGEYSDPVAIFEHPIVTFVVVVDHGQQANCRVNCQHPAEFPDGCAKGNFQVKGDFPEIREIGVIAF